jgi:biotin synthase
MKIQEIYEWLRETDQSKLSQLWQLADQIRHANVGNKVHLRGLLEISNHCVKHCAYCGISASMETIDRYRMTYAEITNCINTIVKLGYGTVVMQAGEDYGITTKWLTDIIRYIKDNTPLAITLSMGERPLTDLEIWKKAGADRYLLRFETSDRKLYQLIHPSKDDRLIILKTLKQLGYEVGSGVMIGIPGQTYQSLAHDINLFRELDLDMIGVGPYIPDPNTLLGKNLVKPLIDPIEQVQNNEEMIYKVIALSRLACPNANIPSTTALATLNKINGRELGLIRGANIVMPNVTPPKYRVKYTIYPDKACINETAEHCAHCLNNRIIAIGRVVGQGKGARWHKPNMT